MADEWEWSETSRRYRDLTTGRYLSPASALTLRNDVVSRLEGDMTSLARQLAAREISVQDWQIGMAANVKEVNALQMAFGRGGTNAMQPADRAALADIVTAQQEYLRSFAEDVAAGNLSEAQIAARSRMYTSSSVAAYEQGKSSAWNVVLPAHPGDGSTSCRSQCRCSWSLADKGDEVHATWKLGPVQSEHCRDCQGRASRWSPLVIARPAAEDRAARLFRRVA